MSGRVEARLAELGIELPPVVPALAVYVPAVLIDGWVYTAGQLPLVDGELPYSGIVDVDVTVEEGAQCARICALNGLAAIKSVVGNLDRVQIVKVTGYVACPPGSTAQPHVLNGASIVLGEILGDAGVHARSAVGVSALPINAPVEVELIARIRD